MESAWFRLEEEAEQLEAASLTRLRRSSRLSTEVRHRLEESFFSSSSILGGGSSTSSSAFLQSVGGGLTSRRFEMQARVKRDVSSACSTSSSAAAASSSFGRAAKFAAPPPPRPPSTFAAAFPAAKREEEVVAASSNFATRRTELARRFGMFTRENTKEPSAMPPRDELDEVKKDLRMVKEENLKLQAVITDVTEVNKRWQKYNNDRQMYVEKLLSTIQDQQEQMNKNIENRLLKTKESEDGSDVIRQLHAENAKLRDENGQLKRLMESMEREHKEHVEVLEIQVKANKDDWEEEKREKELARQENERLEAKIQELQEELSLYKLQLREEKSSNERVPSSQRKHCCCGTDGREGHCSSHIMICRKNSFPTFRTSVHVPQGHLIPRGSTIYLGDDLVIDGDSSSSKPAVTTDSGIQGSQSGCSEEMSSLTSSQQQIPPNIPVEQKIEPSGSKDKVESHDKTSLDIPASSAVVHSHSTSAVSSASSVSVASASRFEHLTTIDKEVAGIAKNLVSSSATSLSTLLPPLPTSFSDTVVPDRMQKPSKDSRWNMKAFPSSLRLGTNVQEVAQDSRPKSHDILVPNFTAVDNLEEFPDGVPTQTREDVICPGCGRVFHPEIHLQFLQHFGECQNRNKANKAATFKTRN